MASVANDFAGLRRILFLDKKDKRTAIWLGKVSKRPAEDEIPRFFAKFQPFRKEEKEEEKDRHVRIGDFTKRALSTGPSADGFFRSVQGLPNGSTSPLFRWCDHRVAILVHQGSDPMEI
jgi:hypothetical protein